MNPYLTGCKAKLYRAQQHLSDLNNACEEWINTDPCEVVGENHPETSEYFIVCRRAPLPPLEISILAEDFIHSLRTCLDHLIYALAVHETQQDPPPFESALSFPVFTNETNFRNRWDKRLAIFSVEAQARIEGLQPFRDPGTPRDMQRLWVLNELDNISKHRRLAVVGMQMRNIDLDANKPVMMTRAHAGSPVEDNTVLLYFSTDGSSDVEVKVGLTFDVGFNEPAVLPHYPNVRPILMGLGEVTAWVVGTFERDFF